MAIHAPLRSTQRAVSGYSCGQPRGCPLSPLLGAFFLAELDNALEDKGVFYVRYVNAVLVMSRHRW